MTVKECRDEAVYDTVCGTLHMTTGANYVRNIGQSG
jgi:hypothetical protein